MASAPLTLLAVADWFVALTGLAVLAFLAVWRLRWQRHQHVLSRIPAAEAEVAPRRLAGGSLVLLWERLLPWALGVLVGAILLLSTSMGPMVAVAIGFLMFVVGHLVKATLVGRRTFLLESQLAQSIDHIVTSLHAGVGVLDALQGAEDAARRPFKPYLAALILRVHLGDDPVDVCKDMARLLPLESFRLFFYALAVQWEGGGNLAPTLATTGRFIRDRVEVSRRVRAQSTEARGSVLAILLLTYFLALLMWTMAADRMEGFLATDLGRSAAAVALILQACGAAWVSRIAQVRF